MKFNTLIQLGVTLLCTLITSQALAKTVEIEFIDESGLLDLDDEFYVKSRATKKNFFCMNYSFVYNSFSFKELHDYFPLEKNGTRLFGEMKTNHTLSRMACGFDIDIMYLEVWLYADTAESHNNRSSIAVIEDGNSNDVSVHCRYVRSPTGYLHLDCENAHVLPMRHGDKVTITITASEDLPQ